MLEEGKKKESACSTSCALLYTKVNDIAPDFRKFILLNLSVLFIVYL
jgi:hypothetical protein